MKYVFLLLNGILLLIYSCAPVRTVIPLEKGHSHVSVSAGGPLVRFSGVIIPLPLSSVCFSYGLKQRMTTNVALHTTSLMFGNLHLEGSATILAFKTESENSGFSLTPGSYALFRYNETPFILPFTDFHFFHKLNDKALVYVGYSHFLDVQHPHMTFSSISRWYVPSVQIGHIFQRNNLSFQVEIRYQHFLRSNENIVVNYISPSNRGALALHLGCGIPLQRKNNN